MDKTPTSNSRAPNSHFIIGLTLGSLGFIFTKKQDFHPLLRGMYVRYAIFVAAIISYFVIAHISKLSDGLSREKVLQEQYMHNQTLRRDIKRARDTQEANLAAIHAQQDIAAAQEAEKKRKEASIKTMMACESDIIVFRERINDILKGKSFVGFDANTIVSISTNADVRRESPYSRMAWKYNTDSSLTDIENAAENVQKEVNRLNARLLRLDEYRKAHEAKQQEVAEQLEAAARRLEAAARLQFASNLISRIDFGAIKRKIVMHRYLAKYQTKRTNDYGFLENLYELQQKQKWLEWVNAASAKSSSRKMFYDQLPDTNTISSIVESVKRSRVLVRFSFQKLPSETVPVAIRIADDGQTFVVSERGYGDLEVYTSLDMSVSYVVERGAMDTLNAKIMVAKSQGQSPDDCLYAALSLDISYDAETLRKNEELRRKKFEAAEEERKQRAKQRAKAEAAKRAEKRERYKMKGPRPAHSGGW